MSERVMPDWIEGYKYYMHQCESPDLYLEWSAVSAIAASLQRRVWLQWGFNRYYPNFYILLVGPPGRTRKGTAMAPARLLLQKLGIPLAPDSITREQLIRKLSSATDTVKGDNGLPMTHSSLTIFSPEFCVFLNRKDERLMMDLTDWYDCGEKWSYETKNMGEDHVVGVYVNLLGATTPDLIQTSLPMDAIGSGLTSRIIFACASVRRFKQPEDIFPMTQEGQMIFKNLFKDLQLIRRYQGAFKMSKAYYRRYVDWYKAMPEMPSFEPQRFSGYWSRRPVHLRKLSIVMSVSRNDNELILKGVDFDRAVELLERTEANMPFAFSSFGRDRTAAILPSIMATIQEHKEIKFSELLTIFLKDTNNWELDKIIATLKKTKWITVSVTTSDKIIKYKGGDKDAPTAGTV